MLISIYKKEIFQTPAKTAARNRHMQYYTNSTKCIKLKCLGKSGTYSYVILASRCWNIKYRLRMLQAALIREAWTKKKKKDIERTFDSHMLVVKSTSWLFAMSQTNATHMYVCSSPC
jgi:hypothetical protein